MLATNERAAKILSVLRSMYPNARCGLDFETPFQLLVATVLSAQCTDVRVNMVTPELFRKWPEPGDMALADIAELEAVVRSTGFFRAKAANLKALSGVIAGQWGGKVPGGMNDLIALPGVGRKTANVLKNEFFHFEGIAVDTHVARLSERLGLSAQKNPSAIERDLIALFPREDWRDVSHLLITHGRRVCTARKPDCGSCGIAGLCPSAAMAGAIKPGSASN